MIISLLHVCKPRELAPADLQLARAGTCLRMPTSITAVFVALTSNRQGSATLQRNTFCSFLRSSC